MLVSNFIDEIREIKQTVSRIPRRLQIIKKEINNFVLTQNISFSEQSTDEALESYFKNIDKSINKYPFLSDNPIIPDEDFINDLERLLLNLLDDIRKIEMKKMELKEFSCNS